MKLKITTSVGLDRNRTNRMWLVGGLLEASSRKYECTNGEILILSPHGTKAKTALAGYSNIGEWPLVGFGVRKPGELALLSINRAKGLDSLAVIMIDVEKFEKLSTAQGRMDYFVGASRARQFARDFP